MFTTPLALALTLLAAPAAPAVPRAPVAAQYPIRARVWLDDDRDYYRRGERLRLLYSVDTDAYVAVVHVDPDGVLDFVYPRGPYEDQFARGGRVYSLPAGYGGSGLFVRGSGIGYFYVIASPFPLDYRHFRLGGRYDWDWSYAGRQVRGDPFWALQELTRAILPDPYSPYGADYVSYYVEGRPRYPSYACGAYGSYGGRGWGTRAGWGWSSYYDSCDRLDYFLRDNPYYFDTRRYRGDRRAAFDRYRSYAPAHGYKEDPRVGDRYAAPRRATADDPRRDRGVDRPSATPRPAQPERRPTLERRPEPAPPPREAAPRSARPRDEARPAPAPAPRGGQERPQQPARRRPGGSER